MTAPHPQTTTDRPRNTHPRSSATDSHHHRHQPERSHLRRKGKHLTSSDSTIKAAWPGTGQLSQGRSMATKFAGARLKSRASRVWLGVAAAAPVLAGLITGPANAADVGPPPGSFIIQNYQTKQCAAMDNTEDTGFIVSGASCGNSENTPNSHVPIWIFGGQNSIRSHEAEQWRTDNLHFCLDATGPNDVGEGSVGINPCNGGLHQKWTRYEGGYVKNWATKQCLDVKSEYPRRVYTRDCMHHNWQKWAFKRL
ncbi:ricin-type beta-trefoil lectin domain protein [Streptomyces zaomyceticus]|uniref:ricin-type beta-trefoil lectin domain protein n=1 Tax=Streptomyces zaomyceticus TaxID=68286 RepID=UPI0036C32E49